MQEVNPLNYHIHLEPDLGRFKFDGKCEILLDAPQTVSEVTLNILELAIWSCRLRQGDEFVNCAFGVDPDREEARVSLPEPMSGKIRLIIDYQGSINDKMAGFYRSKYTFQGETRFIAVTQFEESDARRAFPCMDHPAKKATFDITINWWPYPTRQLKRKICSKMGKSELHSREPRKCRPILLFSVSVNLSLPWMKKTAGFGSSRFPA